MVCVSVLNQIGFEGSHKVDQSDTICNIPDQKVLPCPLLPGLISSEDMLNWIQTGKEAGNFIRGGSFLSTDFLIFTMCKFRLTHPFTPQFAQMREENTYT